MNLKLGEVQPPNSTSAQPDSTLSAIPLQQPAQIRNDISITSQHAGSITAGPFTMDSDEDEHFAGPEEFVSRIKEIVSTTCETSEDIDDSLRSFIAATVTFHRALTDLITSQGSDTVMQVITRP